MSKAGYVYFLTNRKEGVIYIGVTSDLVKRIYEHKSKFVRGFTNRYNLSLLVHYEKCEDIETAIVYEKKLKNIHRRKKLEIIAKHNPEWRDLWEEITS